MFEKEAEEYRESKRHKFFRADVGTVQINYESYLNNLQSAFKDGAEFGFQKGIKAKINTTTISDCPIKDEWHFVKDGDLPKAEFVDEYKKPRLPSAYKRHYCLCLGDDYIMGKYIKGSFSTVEGRYFLDDVIAWKEIVPPKESE
jgi:hypothetical protein